MRHTRPAERAPASSVSNADLCEAAAKEQLCPLADPTAPDTGESSITAYLQSVTAEAERDAHAAMDQLASDEQVQAKMRQLAEESGWIDGEFTQQLLQQRRRRNSARRSRRSWRAARMTTTMQLKGAAATADSTRRWRIR